MSVFAFTVEELQSSPVESFTEDNGVQNTRHFKVPFANRWQFVNGMRRVMYPGMSAVRAVGFAVKPYSENPQQATITDFSTTLVQHEFAQVDVSYRSVNFTRSELQPDGSIISYRQSSSVEFQTLPSRALVWNSDDELVSADVNATIAIPTTVHSYNWTGVGSPNLALFRSLMGKVNNATYTLPVVGGTVAAEQLLFNSHEAEGKSSPVGAPEWSCALELIEKQATSLGDGTAYGWNHLYREEPAKWDKPKDEANGNFMFVAADFSTLFTQV